MAKSYDVAADWREVDPASLPSGPRQSYEAYKIAQRLASQAREAFEADMSEVANLPVGQRLAFGYRFGKLSIAVIPDDKPLRKPSSQAATLADFLRSVALTGART